MAVTDLRDRKSVNASRRIPWWEPVMTGGENARVEAVIRSNYLNDGDVTTEFEGRIAALSGASHAVATTSGTTAIFLALAAAGAGPGDEVIVPDVTFIATANAVRLTGATPVLVDIDARTLNVDPERVRAAITPRTKAIVPVHVSGRSADMPAILSIAAAESTVAKGAGLLAVYSAGLGIPFLIAAFMVEQFSSVFARMKRHLASVERAMGVLMIITGIAFLTGAVSNVSIWLLETFPALQSFG